MVWRNSAQFLCPLRGRADQAQVLPGDDPLQAPQVVEKARFSDDAPTLNSSRSW